MTGTRRNAASRKTRAGVLRCIALAMVGVYGLAVYLTSTHGIQSALPPTTNDLMSRVLGGGGADERANVIVVKPPSFDIKRKEVRAVPKELPVVFHNWTNGINEYDAPSTMDERLWERSSTIPQWMKDYFAWHREQRKSYVDTKDNKDASTQKWHQARYMVLECRTEYNKCGGTADRLGPVPFALSLAAASNRILLIHWETPAPLERFLMPPLGGMDWRVPRWLYDAWDDRDAHPGDAFRSVVGTFDSYLEELSEDASVTLVRAKYQSHTHGAGYYDSHRRTSVDDPTFAQVYHDVWRVLFTPSPRVATRIQRYLTEMDLAPGAYSAVHLRALYGVPDRDRNIIESWTRNSIRCATNLPSGRVAFVSDSGYAVHVAEEMANATKIPLSVRRHEIEALHLEKAEHRPAYAYYDTFVDLYIIGMARCTVYNMGGFGRWGSMIGYNSSCAHHLTANMEHCAMNSEAMPTLNARKLRPENPMFLPPMDDYGTESIEAFFTATEAIPMPQLPASIFQDHAKRVIANVTPATPVRMYQAFQPGDPNLWERSKTLPSWMKRYFFWHRQMREQLRPDNWRSTKFLVMQCLETDGVCGGASDRLKPIPALVRVAAITSRVLLIQWERPTALEEFLLPPKGGVDWRVPKWLAPEIVFEGAWASAGVDIRTVALDKANTVVRCRYQSFDAGAGFYDENLAKGETPFEDLYHDLWRSFFTPSPPVAIRIRDAMLHLGLTPGNYASAHLRALYARESRPLNQVRRWTAQALNCASNMRPGKPIFMASDSPFAAEVAWLYGMYRNASIVTHKSNPDPPLHLDKAVLHGGPIKRPASEFYDTFVDLYLLSMGRCVYYNKGGYGHWALLIGGDTKCSIRTKRTKEGIQNPCEWKSRGTLGSRSLKLSEPLFAEPM